MMYMSDRRDYHLCILTVFTEFHKDPLIHVSKKGSFLSLLGFFQSIKKWKEMVGESEIILMANCRCRSSNVKSNGIHTV